MSNDILTELRQRGAAIERQGETNWIYDDAADEIERLRAEIAGLREAIRRLADQDATLSVCEGNVTVTMDATLTDAERDVIEWCRQSCSNVRTPQGNRLAATLRGLLERTGGGR